MKKLIEKQTGTSKIKRRISGFWRRIIAFIVDCIILTTFGKGLGLLFGPIFVQMGARGALVGFGVFVLYFGILNSSIGGGQTLGKKLLEIRVVNVRGRHISFTRAVMRAGILGIFFCLAAISSLLVSETLMLINSLLYMVIGWGIIYFYLFNSITRQSLHDLICGSFVVEADAEDVAVRLVVEGKHYLIYSLMTVILVIGGLYLNSMEFGNGSMNTGGLQNELKKMEGVTDVSIQRGSVSGLKEGLMANQLIVTIQVKNKLASYEEMQNKAAEIILEKYPTDNVQIVYIKISSGYDIGITKSIQNDVVAFSPGKWDKRIYAQERTAF